MTMWPLWLWPGPQAWPRVYGSETGAESGAVSGAGAKSVADSGMVLGSDQKSISQKSSISSIEGLGMVAILAGDSFFGGSHLWLRAQALWRPS